MTMHAFPPEMFFDLQEFEHKALFQNIQYAWQALDHLEEYLKNCSLGHIDSCQQDYVYLVHPELISIGEGTTVEAGAYIRGPCVIGKNCQIRQGAYIRGNVLIGDRCVVGHTSELKSTILLNHVKAAHFAFLGDSIVGSDVNVGAGTKCANLRLDDQPVKVTYKGEVFSTGRRKLGAIIGDGAQIGCNVVCNPGTFLGKQSTCFPSLNIGGVIESKSVIRPIKRMYEVIQG